MQEHLSESAIYALCLFTTINHTGLEMTFKSIKCCCRAQVLHGCSKCTGTAGTCHSALANKAVLKLVCLGVPMPRLCLDRPWELGDSAACSPQQLQFTDYVLNTPELVLHKTSSALESKWVVNFPDSCWYWK